MSENSYLPRDLEESVRWALREQVGDAEPSAAVWESIRRSAAAGDEGRQRVALWSGLRIRPTWQALVAGVVLVGLGLSVGLSSLCGRGAEGTSQAPKTSHIEWRFRDPKRNDTLSGRLVWLASREPAPRDSLRVYRYLE